MVHTPSQKVWSAREMAIYMTANQQKLPDQSAKTPKPKNSILSKTNPQASDNRQAQVQLTPNQFISKIASLKNNQWSSSKVREGKWRAEAIKQTCMASQGIPEVSSEKGDQRDQTSSEEIASTRV